MTGAIGLGLLALLGLGALTQSALSAHERSQFPPPGKRVSVGDHRLHINCQGKGQPLVLLESGLSGWSQGWALVQPELAKQTTVCSYDHAGYAWSDEAPQARTGLLAVEDLRTLLRGAGLQGSMVVVAGHSLGGLLAQMLAQSHPDEVASLVLVDKLPASEQAAARGLAMQSKDYRALHTEYLGIDPALEDARSLPSVPPVPTVVLSTNAISLKTAVTRHQPPHGYQQGSWQANCPHRRHLR
jgi:pimeloyl-ACP methyl ester carboxylesterase